MNELYVKLKFIMPTLSKSERVIAESLMDNQEMICNETLSEFGRRIGSSDATIIRFCKKMGFSGYSDLKKTIMRFLNENEAVVEENIEPTNSVLKNLEQVYKSNVQTLQDTMLLASNDYEEAVDSIMLASKVNFFGAGDASVIAKLFEFKFKRCGIQCSAQADPVFQLIEAQNMGKDDVAVVISYTGRSYNVLNATKVAKKNGAKIIAITKMSRSPLISLSDVNLFIATSDFTLGNEMVIRRTAEQMILDAIYVTMLVRKKEYGSILGNAVKSYSRNQISQTRRKGGKHVN